MNFLPTALLESTLQMMKNGGYSFLISHLNPELLQFL
jgi:hypothetical protein